MSATQDWMKCVKEEEIHAIIFRLYMLHLGSTKSYKLFYYIKYCVMQVEEDYEVRLER